MSRTKIELSAYDYQHAAEVALFGKLPVPPRVNPATSEAYLIELIEPTWDYFERETYTHVVAVVSRGELGSYTETITVFASDSKGNIAEHDERWVNMLDSGEALTHYGSKTVDDVLTMWGIVVR